MVTVVVVSSSGVTVVVVSLSVVVKPEIGTEKKAAATARDLYIVNSATVHENKKIKQKHKLREYIYMGNNFLTL